MRKLKMRRAIQLIKIQDSFDYIHFRNVAQGISKWPEVLAEAYRCMRPGAHIELAEYDSKLLQISAIPPSPSYLADPISVQLRSDDGSLTPDNPLNLWTRAMEEAMAKTGRARPSEEQLKTRLENAGFVEVQSFTMKEPVGPWPRAQYGSLECRCAVFPTV
jgi:ubiquinone/menaquinone biosynthesis C-methylase UbiE